MTAPALMVRLKNIFRFRNALAKVRDDSDSVLRFQVWQHVAGKLGFEFTPAQPPGNSSLQGSYQGRLAKITTYYEEIRVITRFSILLPVVPSPTLIERINRSSCLHQRSSLLLAEFAKRTGRSEIEVERQLGFFSLSISASYLACDVRYVKEAREYFQILAVLSEAAQVLTLPTAEPRN